MKAAGMREETSAETESLWREIEPRLDELVWRLRAQERDVLLLRFYQRKNMAEVGAALGISEDAAKKRVSRAVENLRKSLGQQGIVVTGSALAIPLLAQTTHTAPPALISACNTMSTASATGVSSVAGIAKGAIKMIVTTNIKFAAVTAGCAIAVILLSVGTVLRTTTLAQQAAPQPAQSEPAPATRPKDPRQRARCALNLKAVGMSILLYRNDHKGNYPPDLGALLVTEKLKGTELLCPEGNTTLPADWAAMSNVLKAEWINAHADYTYAGAILTSLSGADSVVGYDKDETLHGDGMNVLFADGRVIYMKTEAAKKAIDDSARRAHANP
jgi:prepilin-type processing-associated H-X9-DG protein